VGQGRPDCPVWLAVLQDSAFSDQGRPKLTRLKRGYFYSTEMTHEEGILQHRYL
jgi:hypothetical protein